MKIALGDRVHDRITGFAGIVTGRLEYLEGRRQFLLKPEKLDKDGKIIDGQWIDEQYLEIVLSGIYPDPFAVSAAPKRGGPGRSERDLPS